GSRSACRRPSWTSTEPAATAAPERRTRCGRLSPSTASSSRATVSSACWTTTPSASRSPCGRRWARRWIPSLKRSPHREADMPDAFSDFLASPSGETFLRLREVVAAEPDYDFYSNDLDGLSGLLTSEDFAGLAARIPELMPGWLLSPRLHQMAAVAAL